MKSPSGYMEKENQGHQLNLVHILNCNRYCMFCGFVSFYCLIVVVSRKASGKIQACVYTMIAGAVIAAR